ncbi:MAG: monovalent cation/H(+) antiporter subunit G [Cyanobacteriota bacterium]|nr:monovalent cation/H(+) antiporter subunit G [Cyanobacteriota bacterium]
MTDVSPPIQLLSLVLQGVGLVLWFWGTWPLLERGSLLRKLHKLSVADTLGSALILLGLLLRIPRQWPLLCLAMLGLVLWNTIFGYVLANCSLSREQRLREGLKP